MPTPVELRSACYAIIAIAKTEPDKAVKRILAGRVFAQEAQIQGWIDAGKWPLPASQ
jgi:hypothetical protein